MDVGFLYNNSSEEPRQDVTAGSKVQVCCVYAAIIADVFITAYTDTLDTTEVLTIILLLSLQIFLLLAIILAFFLLTTSISPHVRLGLYNKYMRTHRTVFGLCLLTLLLVGSVGAYRMVLVYRGLAHSEMWGQPGYLALWVAQRISLLLLQCTTAHATALSLQDTGQAQLASAAATLMATVRQLS